MLCETVYLREAEGDMSVRLETYVCRREGDMTCPPRPAMIVFPGGAYLFLAEREGEPVARAFSAKGYNTFVLYYSIGEKAANFRPLVDASMAIAHIRRNAEKYNIDPDKIFTCGFSAGGHLSGSIGTFWNRDFAAFEGMKPGENKPCGVILSYPAVTMCEDCRHEQCAFTLAGQQDAPFEKTAKYSLERHVTEDTVPHFIWQTQEDDCVPVEHSMLLANALIAKKIPVELHIYPKGPHGMSICTYEVYHFNPSVADPHVGAWLNAAFEWCELW